MILIYNFSNKTCPQLTYNPQTSLDVSSALLHLLDYQNRGSKIPPFFFKICWTHNVNNNGLIRPLTV